MKKSNVSSSIWGKVHLPPPRPVRWAVAFIQVVTREVVVIFKLSTGCASQSLCCCVVIGCLSFFCFVIGCSEDCDHILETVGLQQNSYFWATNPIAGIASNFKLDIIRVFNFLSFFLPQGHQDD